MMLMHDYWSHRGGLFGRCHSHADAKWFWVNIPKNASSFTQTLLAHQLLWYEMNYHLDDLKDKTPMVVLRDPITRWVSGITEYINRYQHNFETHTVTDQLLDWIFDTITFDDHTERQHYFVQNIDLHRSVCFYCDHLYQDKLISWMESVNLVPSQFEIPDCVYEFAHETNQSERKRQIAKYFADVISAEPKYQTKLRQHFYTDYELIGSLSFV